MKAESMNIFIENMGKLQEVKKYMGLYQRIAITEKAL